MSRGEEAQEAQGAQAGEGAREEAQGAQEGEGREEGEVQEEHVQEKHGRPQDSCGQQGQLGSSHGAEGTD